ncbi:hypothetical protein EGR_11089 [Echinococcus granulosus]|uniref:Uncharacterized protein n=1 Tax=Echinococcus granulosus TaxID=6210 RepID=W6U0S8_ECHGR|nr:hypothetical protein EGR_11089 [Echinococcus granulosus]EUB54051.1 hypothetical protein EGR_11089 [Echinococcus granulosus]
MKDVHELYASSMDQVEDRGLERQFCKVLSICSQSAVFFPFRPSLPMVIRLLPSLLPLPLLMELVLCWYKRRDDCTRKKCCLRKRRCIAA